MQSGEKITTKKKKKKLLATHGCILIILSTETEGHVQLIIIQGSSVSLCVFSADLNTENLWLQRGQANYMQNSQYQLLALWDSLVGFYFHKLQWKDEQIAESLNKCFFHF